MKRLPNPDWAEGYYSVGMVFTVVKLAAGAESGEIDTTLVYGTYGSYMRLEDVEPAQPRINSIEMRCEIVGIKDPYESHRAALVEKLIARGFRPHPDKKHGADLDHYAGLATKKLNDAGATNVLMRGLESEKPRTRAVAFPKEGRSDRALPRTNQ